MSVRGPIPVEKCRQPRNINSPRDLILRERVLEDAARLAEKLALFYAPRGRYFRFFFRPAAAKRATNAGKIST